MQVETVDLVLHPSGLVFGFVDGVEEVDHFMVSLNKTVTSLEPISVWKSKIQVFVADGGGTKKEEELSREGKGNTPDRVSSSHRAHFP